MLFGTIDTFAIEAHCEAELVAPSAVWGRMRIWCQGCSIGDFEESHCALFPAYCGFKALDKCLPSLWRRDFEGLSDLELWNHLDGLLYGFHGDVEIADGRTYEECRRDRDEFGKFDFLTNWGEQFDYGGKSFIVCTPDGYVRILNRSLPSERGIALSSTTGQVTESIREYLSWFEGEAERLKGKTDA